MKKRFLAAVLALVMTAACLTACGGEDKTEDKQQTTTTTTEETTTTTETTTATTQNSGCGITTLNVTTTRSKMGFASEVPQDLNPGAWLEDSETTTTTTTTKAATTTKPKTTTTKAATTTTKAKTTTKGEERRPSEVPQDVNPGQWHEDPGITKADLKAAAEAAFAKVKKTAKEYGWTISKTFVNRSTDTQYGIYCLFEISEAASADGAWHSFAIVFKAENINGFAIVQASQTSLGVNAESENYDDFSDKFDISYVIKALKERY